MHAGRQDGQVFPFSCHLSQKSCMASWLLSGQTIPFEIAVPEVFLRSLFPRMLSGVP